MSTKIGTKTSRVLISKKADGHRKKSLFQIAILAAIALVFATTFAAANKGSWFGQFFNETAIAAPPPSTVTVTQDSLQNWLFYNDETDVIDNTLGSFRNGPGSPPLGSGGVQISVTGTQRRNLATYQFSGTQLANITEMKFSTYNPSAGNGGSANRSGYLNFNVDFNGSDTWQKRLSFIPSINGAVVQNTWQEWDTINGGNANWLYSGATWPVGTGEPGTTPGTTSKTWSQILSTYPGVRIRVTDSFWGIRVGEPYNDGYTENIDAVKFGVSGNTTTYDFERAPTVIVDDDGFASATDCNASDPATVTIGAAATAAQPGDTIRVCPGTYTLSSTVNLNKAGVTVLGVGPTKPVVQAASGIGNAFFVTASNVTLNNLEIQKTDLANQELVAVQGANFTAINNLIYGPDQGAIWNVAGYVSRAFVISNVLGTAITNNVIHTLRQPAYMSGTNGTVNGTITGNQVSGTKGWVVEGGKYIFTGNTFGEPQNQSCDIALIPSAVLTDYAPLTGLSLANDDAFICAQFSPGTEDGRAISFVDDGAGPSGNGSDNANYNSITSGISGTLTGGTVQVAGGTYNEDVVVSKSVKVAGAGAVSTTVSGPIGGGGSTFQISASNVELSGFKITRAGNNTTDWNAALNSAGVSVQGTAITGMLLHDNLITGMRTAIDINNSNGHTIRNNVIDDNRTGMIFRNQTDNLSVVENTVTNNWTVGILFLDGSGGTNSPVQTALNSTFFNNNISGNWYGGIVDRQNGGSIPAPGTTNLKNFSGNWYGTNSPVVTTADTTEPGYAAQIPVEFGGSATPPGGQPDIAGPASANFDYSPFLNVGTDTNVETTLGRGTYGFQGSFNVLNISASSPQVGAVSKIQEAIDLMPAGGTLTVPNGTYPGNVDVNKAITVKGIFTISPGTLTVSASGATLSPGTSPGIINSGDFSLSSGSNLNMEINGTTAGTLYDQVNVTGTVSLGGANLNITLGYSPAGGDSFTIINNDGGDAVTGIFAGLPDGTVFSVGGSTLRIDYDGGDGNDVVLTAVSLCNTVTIPTNITTLTGVTVDAPINVDDTTGHGLISTDFTITFNPSVVTFNSVTLGTVTAGSSLTFNSSTPGTLKVSIFNTAPFSGAGTLATVKFNAVGAPGTSSPVSFSAFKFNEGTPCLTTSNGLISILSGTVTGTITYGNPVGAPAVRGVPNATVNAVGSINTSASTNASGVYTLSGMGSGPYTMTPTKSGGTNGALSGFDSAYIAQHVVGLITLNATQLTVADVSGTGGVTSFDAALIARYVVALPASGSSGNWTFTPANRSYANVNTNQTGQDYVALLMGDVTGNWNDPTVTGGSRPGPGERAKLLPIRISTVSAERDSEVVMPVMIGDLTGRNALAYQFEVRYDPTVLQPAVNSADNRGTISDGFVLTVNPEEPGLLRVVAFGSTPLDGAGKLVNLRFQVIGDANSSSDLKIENLDMNEGKIKLQAYDGKVEVSALSNSPSISGRILSSMGQGIAGARVTLTDMSGNIRAVSTSSFGNFRFAGLEEGQSYTFTVAAKRYRFTPQTVSAGSDALTLDLIADQ